MNEDLPLKSAAEVPEKKIETLEAIESLERSIEISPALRDDMAIFVIKPDAFPFRDAIVERVGESGLSVVSRNVKELTERFVVGAMYDPKEIPAPVIEATKRHMLSGPSEIVLVKGDDAVRKLLAMVGVKTNPALCDPDSIRYIYGNHVPEELGEGLQYYRNAAHRSRDAAEAEKDLKNFGDILQ
jgi:nucleoside diphosphate kinase